ncbi:MAG: CvpA family protein [Magnetococcales bacterium]|nr:CvpA family protein [Magnetococcales bacterium]
MNWLDYFILFVVGLSTVFAALRGFLREVISLVGWVASFMVASQFQGALEPQLHSVVKNGTLAGLLAFGILFVATLIVMGIIGHLLKLLASSAGLSALDRGLGMFFGLGRGALIVTVGFMIYLSFDVDPPGLVNQSVLSPTCINGARQLGRLLPEGSAMLTALKESYGRFEQSREEVDQAGQLMEKLRSVTGGIGGGGGGGGDGGERGGGRPAKPDRTSLSPADNRQLEDLIQELGEPAPAKKGK